MNVLDLVILLVAAVVAVGGYRLGFFARLLSWLGLGIGVYLAARFLPAMMRVLAAGEPTAKLAIAVVLLLGGAFVGQGLGLVLGVSLRRYVPHGPLQVVDRGVGAGLGVVGVVVTVWLLLPSLAVVPGSLSRQARTSLIARAIDRSMPEPPDALQALRRLVGEASFPRVFEALRPAPQTGPPPANTGLAPAVLSRVASSTVKVSGVACRRVQEGSGFAAGRDTVVTNAHVVAGNRAGRTLVSRPDGRRLPASVVVFDSDRDLAVLQVPGLGQQPLGVAEGSVGSRGAVFGHPGGQERLRVAPAAIRQEIQAVGRDLYDARPTRREVFILASDLRSGDSGAALVNPAGAVVGVTFAIAPDRPHTAYALTDTELRSVLARPRRGSVSTGPCLTRS